MTETIRWESLSHEQIYYEVHTGGVGAGLSVAGSVPVWQEASADLNEVRALYESAMRRLQDTNAGASADAARAGMHLVVRGLTDALQLALHAGAKRARLYELNLQLREDMPEPVRPVEHTSGFLNAGVAWLGVQDFHGADIRQHDAAERARDLMRQYEEATQPARLAEGAPGSAPPYATPPAYAGRPEERTIPRVSTSPRVDPGPQVLAASHGFGPTGFTPVEPPLEEPQPGKDDDSPKTGFAGGGSTLGGAAQTRRDESPWADDNLFGSDDEGFPPVIGG